MKRILINVAFFAVILSLFNCSKDEDDPSGGLSITSVSPESGTEGELVVISGKGFSTIDLENVVKFNGIETDVQLASATELAVTVPPGATTGNVTVTTGGKTATGPVFTIVQGQQNVTKPYYIKFKANGVIKIFEDGNPGSQSCGDCACSYMPALSDSRNSSINICNVANDWITSADIQSWNGDKILFDEAIHPVASFSFTEDDIFYTTASADQTGSEVNITSVVADGEYLGIKMYKVTGNFKCKVAEEDGASPFTITEGTFVVRYSED